MSCDQREQGVIPTPADTVAWVEVGTALPDDDLAGVHLLAAEPLDAEPLRIGVPTIASRGRSLFMCHVVASALDICD
jgi:hypothetical protein